MKFILFLITYFNVEGYAMFYITTAVQSMLFGYPRDHAKCLGMFL